MVKDKQQRELDYLNILWICLLKEFKGALQLQSIVKLRLSHFSTIHRTYLTNLFLGPDFHTFPQGRDKSEGHKSVDFDDIDDDEDDGMSDEMTSSSSLPMNDSAVKRNDAIDDYDAKADATAQDSGQTRQSNFFFLLVLQVS